MPSGHQKGPSRQGFGNSQHHQAGISQVFVRQVQDHEDDQHGGRKNEKVGPGGADLVFEFSAPLDVYPLG